jgi:hypothetical protein
MFSPEELEVMKEAAAKGRIQHEYNRSDHPGIKLCDGLVRKGYMTSEEAGPGGMLVFYRLNDAGKRVVADSLRPTLGEVLETARMDDDCWELLLQISEASQGKLIRRYPKDTADYPPEAVAVEVLLLHGYIIPQLGILATAGSFVITEAGQQALDAHMEA